MRKMVLLRWSVGAVGADSIPGGAVGGARFGVLRLGERRVPSRDYEGRGKVPVAGERGVGVGSRLVGRRRGGRQKAGRQRAGRRRVGRRRTGRGPGPDKTQGPGGFSWCEGLPPTDPSGWGRYFFYEITPTTY